MKRLFGVLLIAGAALVIGADEKKDDAVKEEMKKFEGTWVCVSVEQMGEKAPADAVKGIKAVVKGDKVTISQGDMVLDESTYTVDPTKKPKTMDITTTTGTDKGKKSYAIYQLDGDKLLICMVENEKDRPKELATKKDSKGTLIEYKREKK